MLLEIFLPIFFILLIICISEKPKYFRKQFIILNKFLKNIEKKEKNHSSSNELKFYDLTPIDDSEEKACGKLLKFGLENEKVLNIAVTGPYGSGKSSFLKSFESKNGNYNYLNISLASFDDSVGNDKNTKNKIEKIIEENILQQIIYKESADKLPNSRIKRIKEIDFISFLSRIILLYIWLNIFYVKFKKEAWKDYESLFLDFNEGKLRIVLTFYLIIGVIYFIYLIAKNFGINKIVIKALDNEIELGNNKETSVFYKYLDEIIYFFKNTKYDVVFFEDIDRFENINVDLFTKLRELNGLLNSSNDIERKIKFVYAVKDDLFENEKESETVGGRVRKEDSHKLRTKFFDLIVPIIPFVDYSNSTDEMIKNIWDNYLKPIYEKSNMNENIVRIKKRISNICLYINDMRVINNISNEFIIYRENINGKFETKVDDEKLLGYIVYKNLYPKDFSDLHNKKGMVYTALTDKSRIKEESLKNIPLIELLKRMNKKDIFNEDICKENILIEFLKDGIINEDYSLYISFFKEGKKTRNDIEYMRAFRNGKDNLVDYKINNPQIIIEEYLYQGDFEKIGVVNFYLINYLIRNKEKYTLYYEKLINFINTKIENFIFVENILPIIDKEEEFGLKSKNYENIILKTFSKEIKNFWTSIEIYCSTIDIEKEKYLYLILEKCNANEIPNDKDALTNSINNQNNFLYFLETNFSNYIQKINANKHGIKWWITNLEKKLIHLKIKIKKLDGQENSSIFNIIYNNELYEVNFVNINNIINTKCSLSEEEKMLLEVQPYTLITSKMNELEKLKDYLDNNIQEFVKNVILFKNSKVQESKETLLKFYKLPTKELSLEVKNELIILQNVRFENIREVDGNLWSTLVLYNKVSASWENVLRYFEYCGQEIDESLVKYLNNTENALILGKNKLTDYADTLNEELSKTLDRKIVMCKELKEESFELLINSLYFWDCIDETENISAIKIATMIKHKKLTLTEANIEELLQNHEEKVIDFLLIHKENFLDSPRHNMDYREKNQKEVYLQFFKNLNSIEKIKFIKNFDMIDLDSKDSLYLPLKEFIINLNDISIFDNKKIEQLMVNDLLPITVDTYDVFYEKKIIFNDEFMTSFFDSNQDEIMKKVKELRIDEPELKILFDVLKSNANKFDIINNLNENLIYKDSELLNNVVNFLLEEEHSKIEFTIFIKIISCAKDSEKIELFLKQLKFLSTNEIKTTLLILGDNYKKIVNNKKIASFNKDDIDNRILNKLQEKKLITVNQNGNKVIVNLKW